jgi:glycosyltransferase 2 family protein
VKNAIRLLVGVAVSGICLYFATRGTDWSSVGRVLAQAKLGWMLVAAAFAVTAIVVRAQRWRVLLRPVADVPLGASFSATAIGFGATAVLPLRLGEIVRPALLARRVGIGIGPALSSVVLERIFDLLFVILCFLALSMVRTLDPNVQRAAIVLGSGAAVVFVAMLVAVRRRAFAERLVAGMLGILPVRLRDALSPIVTGLFDGLAGLGDVTTVVKVIAYSAVIWTLNGLPFMFSLVALDIDVPLVAASLAGVVVVSAFVMLPQAPGFLGTWQLGCVEALKIFDVPEAVAFSFSLLTWALTMLVTISLGGICLAREDLSVRQLLDTTDGTTERAPQ